MVPSNKYRPEKTQRHQGENAETDPMKTMYVYMIYVYRWRESEREREIYIYI